MQCMSCVCRQPCCECRGWQKGLCSSIKTSTVQVDEVMHMLDVWLTIPLKRPAGPCCCTAALSTWRTGWLLPHWMVVLAKSSGMVALAAQAPLKPPSTRCSQVCSLASPRLPSTILRSLHVHSSQSEFVPGQRSYAPTHACVRAMGREQSFSFEHSQQCLERYSSQHVDVDPRSLPGSAASTV